MVRLTGVQSRLYSHLMSSVLGIGSSSTSALTRIKRTLHNSFLMNQNTSHETTWKIPQNLNVCMSLFFPMLSLLVSQLLDDRELFHHTAWRCVNMCVWELLMIHSLMDLLILSMLHSNTELKVHTLAAQLSGDAWEASYFICEAGKTLLCKKKKQEREMMDKTKHFYLLSNF